ncbi:unnamed protein product, partial [Adineta ricciae]
MFKLPDSNAHHTSINNNKYSSEFEADDVQVWTKLFDRSQILDDRDRHRINHIFNKLITSIVKYEREQDFQLLEALAKRILSPESSRGENEEPIVLTAFDQERLIKLRTLCKRLKYYDFIEKLLSTMFIREKSNELFLPPINKTPPRTRLSSLSFDDARISLPLKKKPRISAAQSPTSNFNQTKPKPTIMMHGPLTLQNIYQAIPAAPLQFAENEYVWHANRPVNMIEDIIHEYEKRHPSDHYTALREWKERN